MRLFLIYAVTELAVLVALVSTIGLGWTLLAILATFVAGLAIAGSQVARHLVRLRETLTARSAPSAPSVPATDSALVALGAVLVVIPGLASSLLGALLLLPPTRRLARPLATALIDRRLAGVKPLVVTYPGGFRPDPGPGRDSRYMDGQVIDVDGEVIDINPDVMDVIDIEPTVLDRRGDHSD